MKKYIATFTDKDMNCQDVYFTASNLREAKQFAQQHKRHHVNGKGVSTYVRLKK